MSFVNGFKNMSNFTESENGGKMVKSTDSDLLNLFAIIGGLRNRSYDDIVNLWLAARKENSRLADNLILYAGSIRDGLGERRIRRILLKELTKLEPEKVKRNLDKIIDVGRWDDIYCFIDTSIWNDVIKFVEEQLRKDIKGMKNNEPISLLSKWLKSSNTSSKESRELAKKTYEGLGISERTYRKTLSALRKYIDVVERKMSAGKWDEINFEAVPSVAMNRYINTYNKRCGERFQEYKEKLCAGEAKVNASVLYPYDIVLKYLNDNYLDSVDEAQWQALPNYIDESHEVVVLADVSGSMTWDKNRPLATSIGLATYFAQRNKGAYHNMYLTFTDIPHFITIKDGMRLKDILWKVRQEGMGYSTNLDLAMKAIYDVAAQEKDVPKALIVISDSEIDPWYSNNYCDTIASKWEKKYEEIGLQAPKLILWNVESRKTHYLASKNDNVGFISGYGLAPFKSLTSLIEKSAYEAMVEILSKPEFSWK